MHSVESRCVTGPSDILFVGVCVCVCVCVCVSTFQPGILTGWGSEGVKTGSDKSRFYASFNCIVQELCESGGGRPGLSVLTSLLVSVDVKNY